MCKKEGGVDVSLPQEPVGRSGVLVQEMYQDLLFHLISAKKPLEGIEHGRRGELGRGKCGRGGRGGGGQGQGGGEGVVAVELNCLASDSMSRGVHPNTKSVPV